jgi:hypothetical protein
MYGMESFMSVLDVEADGIDNAIGSGKGAGDCRVVMHISFDRLGHVIVGPEEQSRPLRMP